MSIQEVIGDYTAFFARILENLSDISINITGCSISHLGYKTSTQNDCINIRKQLLIFSSAIYEGEHNGRIIPIFRLKDSIFLQHGFTVQTIELMPPKPNKSYPNGLEHVGIVIGETLEQFAKINQKFIIEKQDHGPFCRPYCIRFPDGSRVKFYKHSLEKVVKLEGNKFISL
jgi:predicted metalloenzyme YecM